MNNVVIEQLIMRNGQETNVVVMLKSKTRDKMLTLMAKKIELKCRRDTALIKSEERKDKFKKNEIKLRRCIQAKIRVKLANNGIIYFLIFW